MRSASGAGSAGAHGRMAEPASSLRTLAEALATWLREERSRVGEAAGENVGSLLRELGFVTQSEHDELELRVAQLEHRLRLLERASPAAGPAPGPTSEDARTPPAPPSSPTS